MECTYDFDAGKWNWTIYCMHFRNTFKITFCHCRPNWIDAYGDRYYRKEYIQIGFQENDLPQFGKILDIIVV